MSYPGSVKAVAVAMMLMSAAAFACSSGDDEADATTAQPEAPASAPTTAVADATPAAEVSEADESTVRHDIAQQFDLSIEVTSSEFNERKRIPKKYGCNEEDVSPPVAWTNVPQGTVSLALLVDSDQLPGARFVHWVLWGISPDVTELPEAVPDGSDAPAIGSTARQGTNGDAEVGWAGPCPEPVMVRTTSDPHPKGDALVKTYAFSLFALDTNLDLGPDATKEDLLRAIDGHILAGGQLRGEQVGTIDRSQR